MRLMYPISFMLILSLIAFSPVSSQAQDEVEMPLVTVKTIKPSSYGSIVGELSFYLRDNGYCTFYTNTSEHTTLWGGDEDLIKLEAMFSKAVKWVAKNKKVKADFEKEIGSSMEDRFYLTFYGNSDGSSSVGISFSPVEYYPNFRTVMLLPAQINKVAKGLSKSNRKKVMQKIVKSKKSAEQFN